MRNIGGHEKWRKLLSTKSSVGAGAVRVKGTGVPGVPVHAILEKIAEGKDREEILAAFPKLTPDGFAAAAAYAAEVLRTQGGYEKKKTLGAFLTDIKDSTRHIEEQGERAFDLHRLYLETVFHYYQSFLEKPLQRYYRAENFWFPGDALWGVFVKNDERKEEDSIARSMWHYVFSVACGLGLVEDYRRSRHKDARSSLRELKVRGVLLAGNVSDPRFDDNIKIYGGTALNACGRLEKEVLSNSLLLGYVFHRDPDAAEKKMFQGTAGSPRLRVEDLRTYFDDLLRRNLGRKIPGCRIEIDAVDDENDQSLCFTGFPKVLRGLENCQFLVTKVHLVPTKGPGLEIVATSGGARWDRKHLRLKPETDTYDLHQILAAAGDSAFSFMREVYDSGHILFQGLRSGRLAVECARPRFRPLPEGGSAASFVDLRNGGCCVLPTNKHGSSGKKGVLVQALCSTFGTTLRFAKVDVKRDLGERWMDFLDSGCPTLELEIHPGRKVTKPEKKL